MADKPNPLPAGTKAPNFSGKTFDGQKVKLSDYKGKTLALYFYPKDETPGCTKQACNLRDNLSELADAGISVVGVSPDSLESHEKFAGNHELNFPLLADPDHKIINAYGVWGEKKLYGKTFMGLQRATFLIAPDGKIQHVFKRPRVAEHTAEIISKL